MFRLNLHPCWQSGILFILLFMMACVPGKSPRKDDQPRNIQILFLGHDSEHHNSEKYAPILADALSRKGISLTYTSDPDDLNTQNLSWYDGVLIYANHDSITSSQEKALLDFVKGGKGLIPIHCASFCFRNSDEYVDMVGAQFKSHETGTFTSNITNKDHPITRNLEEFETWDETYVHHLHASDRNILMERVEGEHHEPWTWTKDYGKGRVFYTAYGHDERTWSHPGFHALVEQGIIWAVGDRVKGLWAQLTFPEHQYEEKATIPNYEKRDPAPKFQLPFSQEESEKFIQVPPAFDLKLFAKEPDIINPIAMAWDERGRLWVIETVDYPNEVRDNQTGDDRIKICEDTDGDGLADKFTVFAEGMNIPTSIVLVNGGAIISQAPDFLFLKDTDGDDKADIKEKIITGWGTYDTHAGPSNLKYGFDNHIWGTVGYSGFEGNIAGKEWKFRQGFYRFNPEVTEFEFMTSTSNNTWGLGFSETFDVFGSTANNAHSWYMAIPDRYFEGIEGIPAKGSQKIADYYSFHPITKNVRQVDVFNGFTAAAGHNLYTARSFPREYWNRVALVCEPTGHLLAKGVLEKSGAGFKTKDAWNLLASADEWVSPVHAEVGPDGAVWVLDWYNFIIQHNPTPNPERGGFQGENGSGNAHINPLRDREHGRIYRIVYKDAKPYQPLSLSKDDPKGLIAALSHDNMFWRLTAQRLLVERGKQDVLADLYKLVRNQQVDEIGLNGGAIHALWTLHGLGALKGNNDEANEVAKAALSHPAAGVRKAAAQVLPRNWWGRDALVESNMIADSDLHTRLAGFLALADMPADTRAGEVLFAALEDKENLADNWLSQAVYIAANAHREGFAQKVGEVYGGTLNEDDSDEEYRFNWDDPKGTTAAWETMNLPTLWEYAGMPDFDGEVWFYREVEISAKKRSAVNLGPIDDSDESFVNGEKIGATTDDSRESRTYTVKRGTVNKGFNHLLVKVTDNRGGGGFRGSNEDMFWEVGNEKISLAGEWKYKPIRQTNFTLSKALFTDAEGFVKAWIKNTGTSVVAESAGEPDFPGRRIRIKTIANEMKYDLKEFTVKAGEEIEIVFENVDLLQHNLLILRPGSLQKVGKAADELAKDPGGLERAYIPDLEEVMHGTGLVDPKDVVRLRFKVPDEPGEYPYVCTFPGHWQMMNGVMKVVKPAA